MKHNIYYEGRVQSLGVQTDDGYATVGVITPGHYTFNADYEEHVLITSGRLLVKFPDGDTRLFASSEVYVVPARTTFKVEANEDVSYLCRYIGRQQE